MSLPRVGRRVVLGVLLSSLLAPVTLAAQDGEAAVRAVVDSIVAALNAGDAAGIVAHYASDASILPPGEPAVGLEAYKAELEQHLADNTSVFETEILDVGVHGDIAHVRASYHHSLTTSDGEETHEMGNWLITFRNVEGDWKISGEIWAPAPAAM